MLALLPLTLVLLAAPDVALDKAVAKFNTPEALTLNYSSHSLSGNKSDWKLKLMKPDKVLAQSDTQILIYDGKQLTEYTKAAKTYTRNGGTLSELTSRPEMLPAKLFFEKPDWLSKSKSTGSRSRNGVRMTGNEVTMEGTRKGTFYVSDAGDMVLMQLEYPQGTGTETILIDKFELTPGPIDASTFASALPADATEQVEAPKPLSERAKADMAEGRMPYKKLTWEDFEWRNNNDGTYYIGTWRKIDYNYKTRQSGAQYQATASEVEVRDGYDKKGTYRSQKLYIDPALALRHAQGHLDILESGARMARRKYAAGLPSGRGATPDAALEDLRTKMLQIYNEAMDRVKQLDEQYEKDTDHGKKLDNQALWDERIQELLAGPKSG